MLQFIENQTNQYDAYTDRYLEFKVQMRNEIPYKKPLYDITMIGQEAIILFQKFAEACSLFSKACFKSGEIITKNYS